MMIILLREYRKDRSPAFADLWSAGAKRRGLRVLYIRFPFFSRQQVSRFLHATTGHVMLGLQLLQQLVSEMNNSSDSKSLMQQRKVALSRVSTLRCVLPHLLH